MINSNILNGKYFFPVSTSFVADLIYLSCVGQSTCFWTDEDTDDYVTIASEDVGGVVTLKYIKRDATETIVWDENREWLDDKYRYIYFDEPTDIGEQYFSRLEYKLTPYTTTLNKGYYKWKPTIAYATDIELYFNLDKAYESGGNVWYTMRFFHTSGDIYYNDVKVYNGLTQEWLDDSYSTIRIRFDMDIDTDGYNFIIGNTDVNYTATFIAPQLPLPFITEIIGKTINVTDFPYTIYDTYEIQEYGKCILDGYYIDDSFTTRITSASITLTQDTNIYLKFDKITEFDEQKIQLPNNISALNPFDYPEECNLDIKVYTYATRYYGIKKDASNNLYLYKQDGTTLQIWTNNQPIVDEYRFLIINNIIVDVLVDIMENGGTYLYDVSYVTNTPTTISKQEWVTNVGTLPTITPPSPNQLLGWYYDSLFIAQASDNDTISSNVTLYAKIGLPTSINIFLYQNKDSNNSINKDPIQKAVMQGTFKQPTSIVHPVVVIEYNNIDFNYCYIEQFHRYYYVDNIVVVNNKLMEIHCTSDVLMSFKAQLMNHKGIVARNEYVYNNYLDDEREKILKGKQYKIIFARGGTDISSSNVQSNNGNIVLIGVK